jgi:hypothetical protein
MTAQPQVATPETELVIRYVTTDNEVQEGIHHALEESTGQACEADQVDTGIWTETEAAEMIVAERLQSLLAHTPFNDLTPAVHADLLDLALSRVNWHQVAAALL